MYSTLMYSTLMYSTDNGPHMYTWPKDIQSVARACLVHQVHLFYEAAGKTHEEVIDVVLWEFQRHDRWFARSLVALAAQA